MPEDFFDNQPIGFVYRITDNETGKFYVGQKRMQRRLTRPPLKGKVRKRHVVKESDWKKYTSSSNELNRDILKYGLDRFKFEILEFCYDKWSLTYWELWWQLHDNVMFRYDSYNGIINIRLSKFKSIIEKYSSDPRIFRQPAEALNNCMRFLVLATFCLCFASCTVDVTNGVGSQSFTFKTDFSVLNQRQVLTKTSETTEMPDGSKSTKVSEHFEKGFAIEVVNFKK